MVPEVVRHVEQFQIIDFGNSTLYIVGTSVGLFATDKLDGTNTIWEMIGKEEIGNVIIEQIDYRHSDGRLTVATYGRGVFQTTINSVDDILSTVDRNTSEFNIYPNPVHDILNLDLSYTDYTKANIIIYNEVGKIVSSHVKNLSSGNNRFSFSIKYTLKPGIYFISVETKEESLTKQFIKK